MANWKRRVKTGTHRVKIPGTGWLTVKPGQPVLDDSGSMVDCEPEVFGTQAENYIQVGGMPITVKTEAEKAEAKLPPQAAYVLQRRAKGSFYDVVNPANPEKPVNDKALRKADAEALLEQLLGEKPEVPAEAPQAQEGNASTLECPYEDDGFGKVFDSFQECDACAINTQCKAAQEAGK